jgi:ribosomal protein L12E/L44/L45/RPP1/RPP2
MAVGNAVIGALQVLIGADTAELETGLKKAQASLDKFGASVANAGRIAAAGFVLAAAALSVAIKGTINEADKLYKASQSFGVPIEELSALKHAADLSGVSLESLGKGLAKLSRGMMEAAATPTSTAAKAFQALGISVKNSDGTLKSSSALMTEVAGKFAGMKDGAGKTALAIQLFGRAGADLIPMLNLGKTGLQEMITEAEQLGLVIDRRTGAAAEAFNDNLTRMRRVFDGIVIKVTAEMLPAFLQFTNILLEAGKNQALLKSVADNLVAAFQFLTTGVLTTSFVISRLIVEIGALVGAIGAAAPVIANFVAGLMTMSASHMLKAVQGVGAAADAIKNLGKELTNTEQQHAVLGQTIAKFYQDANAAADNLAKQPPVKNEAPVIAGNKDALDKYIDSIKKKNAALDADLQTVGLSEGAHQRLKVILEAEAIAKQNNLTITEAMRVRILEAANATGDLAGRLEESRERWQEFRSAVLSVRSSLENAFTDAIMQAKSFKDVIRSLIQELARMATQQAFRAMFGGPAAWGNAAGSWFNSGGGGGLFASIGKLIGFAQGGSFQVGGSGGIDSQLVAFKASPNERVSITKPGQDMGGGTTVIVNPVATFQAGMTPTDMASVRTMMTQWGMQVQQETIGAIRGAMSRDSRAFAL